MIVLDTSALVAVLAQEDDAARIADAIAAADGCIVSAATVLEASMVMIGRCGDAAADDLDELLRLSRADIVPVTEDHARVAREGFLRFGKGRHPARLNFGDCFSYALARAAGLPLLFKGEDFGHTDVEAVPT